MSFAHFGLLERHYSQIFFDISLKTRFWLVVAGDGPRNRLICSRPMKVHDVSIHEDHATALRH